MTAVANDRVRAPPPWFLGGGGLSGEAARAVNWVETPLGDPSGWPVALKTTVAMMFGARQPMFLWWGDELIQLYNDAYLPSFGTGKHPLAMGQPGRDCWVETWPIIGPQIADVMERGIGCLNEDALVPIFRNGRVEEVYWTYTYSPVCDDDGAIAGTLVICTETTKRVLGERRTNMLHALVGQTSIAVDAASLFSGAFEVLRDAVHDIPFAAFLARDPATGQLTAKSAVGISVSGADDLSARVGASPTDDVIGPQALQLVDYSPPPDACPSSPEPVGQIALFGLSSGGQHGDDDGDGEGDTILALALSPRLPFDESYRRFFEQIVAHLRMAKRRVDEAARRATIEFERRNLLEQAPFAAAVLVGPRHVFDLANTLFRRMVGRPDIVGKAYLEAFPELEQASLSTVLDRVYRLGEPFTTDEYPVTIKKATGAVDTSFFRFTLQPVRDSGGNVYGMMAVGIEITEQVVARRVLEAAEAEREGLLRELKDASRAKDEFLAMLGHELRNPLAPITTALGLMRQKTDDGYISREIQVIDRQVNHLIRLVDDLLDVAKISRGKVELRREFVDLFEVIAKAAEMASDLLELRQHRLSIDCPQGRFVCHADPVRLSQVFANLLTNAAKYTDPGGDISVKVASKEDLVAVAVKDNGRGIARDMLSRVFDLFEQGHRPSDRAEGGLGLGLALVRNLVELHGGRVVAESAGVGRGSTFTVWLPAEEDAEKALQPSMPRSLSPARPLPTGEQRRVLVVDDNADAAELLKESLEEGGHQVEMATDPIAALEIAGRFLPEIAVLDIGLPVIDGYELAARLRALQGLASCRLIALTGYGQEGDRRRSRDAGFEQHLVKPIDIGQLFRLISAPPPG